MKIFKADGEGYDELLNDDGDVIGICPLKRPGFSIQRESLKEAMDAPISDWELEGDAGGNFEFYDNFDPSNDDFYSGDMTITEIYYDTIEEY